MVLELFILFITLCNKLIYNSSNACNDRIEFIWDRAVFTWVSKVICVCFGFALLRSVIGLKISPHFRSQSELKTKPIVSRSFTFSRASWRVHVLASSFDWFTGLSVSFMIGQSNYFAFSFTTLNWKLFFELSSEAHYNTEKLFPCQIITIRDLLIPFLRLFLFCLLSSPLFISLVSISPRPTPLSIKPSPLSSLSP